jgi:ATP-dependent DNA helicase RecQ
MAFRHLDVPVIKPTRLAPRSRLPKYEPTPNDIRLRNALEDWREGQTEETYGRAHLRDLGCSLIMGATVLGQIVDCAHHFKLNSQADLEKETQWAEAVEFGSKVMALVKEYCPTPPPPAWSVTAPLTSRPAAVNMLPPGT